MRPNVLLVLNDPPYGSERAYNGVRHANALAQREDVEVRVSLMADATPAGKRGRATPEAGGGMAGFARGNVYTPAVPQVRPYRPGRHWHAAKVAFEKNWWRNWF